MGPAARSAGLLIAAALVLAGGPAATGTGGSAVAQEVELTEAELADLTQFVNGNALFTLYHEIGHALVHRLEIPVLGREEDAVDSLAAWLMVPPVPDPDAEDLLISAAYGHALAAYFGAEDELAFWDEHSMDLQRFAAIYCLLYGSDPEGFSDLAEEVEMPEGDRERCPSTYAQVEATWLTVLAPHLQEPGAARSAGRIVVRFDPAGPDLHEDYRRLVEEPGLMAEAADDLSAHLALPADIPVIFKACGETNAFYDPQSGAVEMCYELIAWFADLYMKDLAEEAAESDR